jgi:hypothetical protein
VRHRGDDPRTKPGAPDYGTVAAADAIVLDY